MARASAGVTTLTRQSRGPSNAPLSSDRGDLAGSTRRGAFYPRTGRSCTSRGISGEPSARHERAPSTQGDGEGARGCTHTERVLTVIPRS